MGAYTSIRGWVGLYEDEMVESVREVVRQALSSADRYGLTLEVAALYNRGWIIPEDHINWTHYVFYGADIRTEHIDYIRDQVRAIAAVAVEDDGDLFHPDGVFYVDEDGTFEIPPAIWELGEGRFEERQRTTV